MKFILSLLTISAVQLVYAQKIDPDDIISQEYEETFNFIFKLDSVGLTNGKLNYLFESSHNKNEKLFKNQKLTAHFSKQNDSIYQVIINRQKFSLNTLSGRVYDSKSESSVYRNIYLRIAESHRSDVHGTDSLGNWTASYGGFKKDFVSTVNYEPTQAESNKTVEYRVRHTPYTDGDSTWIESDTTRTTLFYDTMGRKQRELTERYGSTPFPETIEYVYTYSGDTCMATLVRFESKLAEESKNSTGIVVERTQFSKTLSTAMDGGTHNYYYSERKDSWYLHITDSFEKRTSKSRVYIIEDHYLSNTVFSSGYNSLQESHYKQTFTYTPK